MKYLDGVKKSRILFTPKEMGMLKKVMENYIVMIQDAD